MEKIIGIDLGTNSIGLSVRNVDRGHNLQEQLEYFASVVFKSGVGKGQSGEYSYAAERTKHRSSRRLYQARRYRKWATLELLISKDCCPLLKEDLDKWRKYDKAKGYKRQYPINDKFEQWIRLDFDGDGKADYSSPYQLRAELMEKQFDFTQQIDRYKLGRALYHIAQRRGFKSSKGETMKEREVNEIDFSDETEIDITEELKKSEEKKSKDLKAYMKENNLKTVGCAFAKLEKEGVRIRNSNYQAVRSQYKDEIRQIFEFQEELDINSEFYKRLTSEKKGEGTIFYKRPLRSQKGLVGKCTLEKNKRRCPISHPEFEKFRAWSFINNIKFRKSTDGEWQKLTLEQSQKLYKEKFLRTAKSFKFQEIREWIEREIKDNTRSYILKYNRDKENSTINYSDKTNVSGCPISGRLKNLLGTDWETIELKRDREHKGEKYDVSYNAQDIWHIAFSFDEAEFIKEFAEETLKFDKEKTNAFIRLHNDIQQGYSMLSLKAIKNINRFLEKGFIYTEAVLLAKLPEIFDEKWQKNESKIESKISSIISENRKEKDIKNITNTLIANYKSLGYNDELNYNEKFAENNYDYKLQSSDYSDILKVATDFFGEKTWKNKNDEEKKEIIRQVAQLYQDFFSTTERDYYKLPRLSDSLAKFLLDSFRFLDEKKLQKIYHPSMIEVYQPAEEQLIKDGRRLKLLGSPVIGAIKNPMAMRVLHTLRKQINSLLKAVDENGNPLIDENTRVVVETARDINDANMRWAINAYQDEREAENKAYEKAITELLEGVQVTDDNIDKVRLLCDQYDILSEEQLKKGYDNPYNEVVELKKIMRNVYNKKEERRRAEEKLLKKYRLWLEQGCRCIYTGKIININSLFDDNVSDFEHTIPRSKSFDNSLANQTICDAYYNRVIKRNRIPTELENYEKDAIINGENYTAILPRLKPWFDKVERLKENVKFWRDQSRYTTDKERKDYCIRQRHLWQMDLDYWQNKLSRFTMREVTTGFRNSQLVDTRIITKYAYHYLKTVFNKVEVQNGRYTSDYRIMLGIQDIDKKKDRSKHSHHAIDATVLTLIPTSARRDEMLELFYKKEEERKLNGKTDKYNELNRKLQIEIRKCGFGGQVSDISKFIENNILVNHISKDQTLTPAHKRWRVRGKVVWQRDKDGKIIYKDGKPQPKRWITGDSIRGKLHGETFYGAITQGKKDKNGSLIRDEEGKIQVNDDIIYVVRRELKYKKSAQDAGFSNWDDLEKVIVDKALFQIMKNQFDNNVSFKDACNIGFYMLDKHGNKVNKIRRVRCRENKNPIIVKQHTYLSRKTYKQNYYATNGENLYYGMYWDGKHGTARTYDIRSLMQLSEILKNGNINSINDFFEPTKKAGRGSKAIDIPLYYVLTIGTRVLIYQDDEVKKGEIASENAKAYFYDLETSEQIKRLYVMARIFDPNDGRLQFKYHAEARDDKQLLEEFPEKKYGKRAKNGFSKINSSKPYPKLLLSPGKLNFLIENKDFIIENGEIIFL
jgi:CRISPR-associated endonuclease Csn1